jgi:hypothetical protein
MKTSFPIFSAISLVVLLCAGLTALGIGAAEPKKSPLKKPVDELGDPPKMPAAEFQQPPLLPPGETPAKPASLERRQKATTPKNEPPKSRTLKRSDIPLDPIFVGWPKPKAAIVITGMEEGYIEPCGCAGIDRMMGGMSRRYTFFQKQRQAGWPLVMLDVGGLANGFGRQAEMKFQTLV